ncbi:MAG: M23 family metallopeptidase [Rhodobacterales bacterium]|jgi:murein DD-endopeptidase MepM/ murein hydrolase activator NlpD|nr:M23 family metallopeptidase [Rhodobacter sp.]
MPMKQEFGHASRRMYPDQIGIAISLPAEAPSISQLYWRLPKAASNQSGRAEHLGIDITAKRGTSVIAPADGHVIWSFFEPLFGNRVVIDHGKDRQGRRLRSSYWHMSSRSVKVGDTVHRGQKLGGVGNTGVLAGGILHLHFAVLHEADNGKLDEVDPSLFWFGGRGKVVCFDQRKNWPNATFKLTYPVVCRAK